MCLCQGGHIYVEVCDTIPPPSALVNIYLVASMIIWLDVCICMDGDKLEVRLKCEKMIKSEFGENVFFR